MTIPDGTILENRYRVDCLLAKGGMGVIYRGYDTKLQTTVAVKANHFRTPDGIEQFEQEGLILARLRHPSLPRVIDHFSYQETQYMVMDFVEGQDLWEIIQAEGHPLDEQRAVTYMIQVCDAVSYLHSFDPPIIHRDIKPQNIKITPADQAVLVDFGIAKLAFADEHRAQSGARGITPGFSPPEQYTDDSIMPASDIYALGATLYAVLTGAKPPDSVMRIAGKARLESLNSTNGDGISPQLSHLIDHAMQPRPEDRPPNVEVWQQELQTTMSALSLLEDQAKSSETTEGSQTSTNALMQADPELLDDTHPSGSISTQYGSWIWRGLAVATVIIVIGGVGFWLGQTEPTEPNVDDLIAEATVATKTTQSEVDNIVDSQGEAQATLAALAQIVAQQTVTLTKQPKLKAALLDPPTSTPDFSPTSMASPISTDTDTPTATVVPTNIPTIIPTETVAAINTPTTTPTEAATATVITTPLTVLTTTLLSTTETITSTPKPARIAFQSDRDGFWAVYILEITSGSQPVSLTTLPYIGENPVASADGQWLAFSDSRENQPGIYRLNPNSREVSVLVSQFDATNPAWSPNGERLVFDAGNQIDVLDIESGSGFNVAKTRGVSHPVWSPDGQTILFDTEHSTKNYELFTIKVDGRDLTQLTSSDRVNETQPDWSPDGRRIVFVQDDTITSEIHVINTDGSNRIPLVVGPEGNHWSHEHPVWSPDGQKIAFASSRKGNFEIYVMDADGSNLTQLTNHLGNDLHPTWLP